MSRYFVDEAFNLSLQSLGGRGVISVNLRLTTTKTQEDMMWPGEVNVSRALWQLALFWWTLMSSRIIILQYSYLIADALPASFLKKMVLWFLQTTRCTKRWHVWDTLLDFVGPKCRNCGINRSYQGENKPCHWRSFVNHIGIYFLLFNHPASKQSSLCMFCWQMFISRMRFVSKETINREWGWLWKFWLSCSMKESCRVIHSNIWTIFFKFLD